MAVAVASARPRTCDLNGVEAKCAKCPLREREPQSGQEKKKYRRCKALHGRH